MPKKKTPDKKTERKAPPLCKGCFSWENFHEGCWFFWEDKKECPNHSDGFKSVKEHFEINPHHYKLF